MNLIRIGSTIFFLLIIAILLISLSSCSSGPPVYNTDASVTSMSMPTKKIVGAAIISAGLDLEPWVITKIRPGEMKGVLSYGPHRATVLIPYDETKFRIIYQDSENFDYDAETNTIHPRYNSWVKKLEKRIHERIQYHMQLMGNF